MIYKIYRLFLKNATSFKLLLINILFFSIIFLYTESSFSMITNIEKNLAYKYCDSIEKNLFKGLENERILKYEYFLNLINTEAKSEEIEDLSNFVLDVENICSYKLNSEEQKEFKELLEDIFLTIKK